MSDLQQAIDNLRSSSHYKELAAYEPPFNPFEIAGVTHRELTHSSMLAWLLRDEANKEFRQRFVDKIATDKPELGLSALELNDPRDPRLKPKIVKTEEGDKDSRIDVFAHFESLKLVIGIEVKVWAGEQDEQVERYQKFLCREYSDSDYARVIVFLTPRGYPSRTKSEEFDALVLEMSWSDIAWMIRDMRAALGNENDFRMQFSQHLDKNIAMNETEGQRLVRKLLSEGDNAEILAKIIDHESSLQGKVRELLSEGDNAKTLAKIIDNMPSLLDYSDQWQRIVAKVCGVKEPNSLDVIPYTTKDGLVKELRRIPEWRNTGGIVKELKICIPAWQKAGLPFTLMLYKYQKSGVRILLHKSAYPTAEAKLKEFAKFANRSDRIVNDKFPMLDNWDWHSVLVKDGKDEEVKGTLIDNIWGEGWADEAEKRLREQIEIEGTGLLRKINEWIENKRRK